MSKAEPVVEMLLTGQNSSGIVYTEKIEPGHNC